MDATGLIVFLVIGAVAGWLAGNIMRGGGFGLIGNIIVGIIGAFLGSWIFKALNVAIGSGLINSIVTALVGAIVLLFLVGLIKRA